MAYTKKPSGPPVFDAANFTKALTMGVKLPAALAAQYIEWKQWVESTDNFDGADKGGLRDVLDADMKAVDALKKDVDTLGQSMIEVRADVQVLKEAPAPRPFP
jgi:hypothetical protein